MVYGLQKSVYTKTNWSVRRWQRAAPEMSVNVYNKYLGVRLRCVDRQGCGLIQNIVKNETQFGSGID